MKTLNHFNCFGTLVERWSYAHGMALANHYFKLYLQSGGIEFTKAFFIKNNMLYIINRSYLDGTEDKFRLLNEIIERHDADRILVYCRFIRSREQVRKRFPCVNVLSNQKHTLGLNLQHANVIVAWDKVWDYALVEQRNRRIYRAGQVSTCHFYELTGNVNLEKMIDENVQKKGLLLSEFKQHGYKQALALL